jgi:zinc protease
VAFRDRVQEVNTGAHWLYRPLTPAAVSGLERARALDFYRGAFANAADFTLFVVGAFTLRDIEPLLCRYVASLPSRGHRMSGVPDPGLAFPEGTPRVIVRQGGEPKSLTTLTFLADAGRDPVERHRAQAAANILRTRLRGLLREEKGQTYGAQVGFGMEDPLSGYGTIQVSFGSAPGNAEGMVEAVLREIRQLQESGPPPGDVRSEQEIERRELEVSAQRNEWWLGSLQTAHLLGWKPAVLLEGRKRIDTLSPGVLRDAFRRYFPLDRNTVVTLLPAETVPATASGR